MRKYLALIMISCIAISVITAAPIQKIYTHDDEIYERVELLCRKAGVLGPSTFTPVNGQALLIALERIPVDSLSSQDVSEFKYLMEEIAGDSSIYQDDYFSFDMNLDANFYLNIADYKQFDWDNTSGYDKNRRNETLIPYKDEIPTLSIFPQIGFGDNAYLEMDLSVMNNGSRMFDSNTAWLLSFVDGEMSFFGGKGNTSLVNEWPYRAGGSLGTRSISFILGRFNPTIGPGITGNMVVGDNFAYQEISNLTFQSSIFSYNISVTRFDQMQDTNQGEYIQELSRKEFTGNQQFRVIHGFDLALFDKFRFSIDLGTIYNSTYGFDMRFFYPFVIAHNYYNYTNDIYQTEYDEANNIMGFSFEWLPTRGLALSGELVIDQFKMFFEDEDKLPNAWGALLNLKYTTDIKDKGILDTWFEAVYTNPYLYLNGKINSEGKYDYNLDYIVGYYMQYMNEYGYTGYIYGPDSIVLALGLSYDSYKNWSLDSSLLFRIQGQNVLRHSADRMHTYIDFEESIMNDPADVFLNTTTPSGGWKNAEYLLQFKQFGSYEFEKYDLSITAGLGLNLYFNYNNLAQTVFKPQGMIGISYKPL